MSVRAIQRLGAVLILLVPAATAAAVFRTGAPVMGTVLQVTIVAGDDATARAAADAAFRLARHWEDVLTTWRADGELARLNASAGSGPVSVSAELAEALRTMRRLSAATGGTFDPAVGAVVDLWRGPVAPSAAALAATPSGTIATALAIDEGTAALRAGIKLDTGGIGKGLALDAIATELRQRGLQAAYLDFGGSSQLAIGAPPGVPGWRVAIGGSEPGTILGLLLLRDAALSTSRALAEPSPVGPIIDPHTRRPIPGPRVATVRAVDATTAEAWSKALIIDGRAAMPRAAAAGLEALLADAEGVDHTAGLRLEPLVDPTHVEQP